MNLENWFIAKQRFMVVISLLYFFSSCTSIEKGVKNYSPDYSSNAKASSKDNVSTSGFPKEFSYPQLLSPNTWFVADRTSVWKSTDSGATWKSSYSAKRDSGEGQIYGVSFVDEQRGFLIDEEKLYKTDDGGTSWTEVGVIQVGDEDCFHDNCYDFKACFFNNPMQGWVVGDMWTKDYLIKHTEVAYEGVFLKTEDGGLTWKRQRLNLPQNHINKRMRWSLHDISFTSKKAGWIAGDNAVFRTIDGGQTWQLGNFRKPKYEGNCLEVNFLDEQFGWVIMKDLGEKEFLITNDGGKNWEVREGVQSSGHGVPVRVVFTKPNVGFLAESGLLYTTKDGGKNWAKIPLNICDDDFGFMERTRYGAIVAFCSNKVIISLDNGITWNSP